MYLFTTGLFSEIHLLQVRVSAQNDPDRNVLVTCETINSSYCLKCNRQVKMEFEHWASNIINCISEVGKLTALSDTDVNRF